MMVQLLESDGGESLPCQVATSREDTVTVVRLAGELDLECVPAIRAELRDVFVQGGEQLRIDLAGVTFIDSTGLGALVWAWKQARMFRMRFLVVNPSPEVARLLSLSGLDRIFTVE
jgi:anti-sigma B factor antagonist